MCERHERLHREAAEKLQAYRILEDRVKENIADAEDVIKYMRWEPPPRADRDLSLQIRIELVDRLAKSSPPFPIGQYREWHGFIRALHRSAPTDKQLIGNLEAVAALILEQPTALKEASWITCDLACAYERAKLYQKSVETYRKTSAFSPYTAVPTIIALVEIGEYEEAYLLFDQERYREKDPESLRWSSPLSLQTACFVRTLEGMGRTEEAAKWRKCVSKWPEKFRKPLPEWLTRKMKDLLPEEWSMIEMRFCLSEAFEFDGPLLHEQIASLWEGDVEFVKHVEKEALKQLGTTYQELISIYYPGFVHDDQADL
jgi:hypothetical protein